MLPERARAWLNSNSIQAESIEQLTGGISSEAYRIDDQFVFRLHTNDERVSKEPNIGAREAYSLQLAAQHDIPAPSLIAADLSGSQAGAPAVLMTLLPGRPQLDRPPTRAQISQMTDLASAIHEITAAEHPYEYRTYVDLDAARPPRWSNQPETWDQAIELARRPPPAVEAVFIHRDFHPGNLLWTDEQLVGLVDWVDAGRGPAGVDAGHCRLNMVQLWGSEVADDYAAAAGSLDPHWDLVSFLEVLGSDFVITDLDQRRRLDEHVRSLVESRA